MLFRSLRLGIDSLALIAVYAAGIGLLTEVIAR